VWAFWLYLPALRLPLVGDDYHWWQLGRAAAARPSLLLAPLGQFWRPLATVQWAVEGRLWDRWATGYHLDGVLLHAACAVALGLLARRLGLGRTAAAAVAALWAGSPLAEEPAVSAAARHDTQLLLAWLLLTLAWPARGERWTGWRVAVAAGAGTAALLAKETWIATPLLVAGLSWARGDGVRALVRAAAPWMGAGGLYAALHAAALPSSGYVGSAGTAVVKALHELAAFLWLVQPLPLGFRADWRGGLAALAVGAAAVWGLRARRPAATVGTALLLAGMLPTLPVPYLPTRYTAAPLAGFLLLAADTAVRLAASLPGRLRAAAGGAAWMAAALVAVAGAYVVRADLVDWARVGAAHRRLLAEAAAVSPHLPAGLPVAVARADRGEPLAEVALAPRGLAKIFYPRPQAPYGLVAPGPLLEWTAAGPGEGFRGVSRGEVAARPGVVLVHRDGGFEPPREVSDLAAAVDALAHAGFPVRVVVRRPVGTWP